MRPSTQAAEGVEKARRDLERARQLRRDEVATEEQVQDLTTAYNVARANLDAARFNAGFARIEAPADGIVFERLAEAASWCRPGQPVVVLGSTASGWVVRVGLADRDVVRMELGAAASVTFDAFPGRSFPGKVTRIGAAADRQTGTFEVEIAVEPQGARFARGLVAKVALPLAPAGRTSRSSRHRRADHGTGRRGRHARHRLRARRAAARRTAQGNHAGRHPRRAGDRDGRAWRRANRSSPTARPGSRTAAPCASSATTGAEPMRLWEFAVRRWQFTLLLFGLLLGVGYTTLKNIPRSEDPEFHAPVPIIVVAYPGADPADIERLIVDPIEDAINELDDIKRMDSRSLDGVGVDPDRVPVGPGPRREVRRGRARGQPHPRAAAGGPRQPRDPQRTGSGLVNIMQVGAGQRRCASYRELDELGRALRDQLETAARRPAQRGLRAARRPRCAIAVDLERMGRAGISLGQVEAAVRGENAVDPGRRGRRRPAPVQPQDLGQLRLARRDRATPSSASRDGRRRAAARRRRRCSWDTAEQRYLGRYNGERAIFVTANAQGSRRRVRRARRRSTRSLDAFEATLPPDITLERGFDQTRNVAHRLDRLGLDFAIAIGLVLLTLLPLGLRAAGVVMISIPLSLAIGAGAAVLHRLLAQPAVDRGLRARARPAGGRLDRGGGEHRALPARGLLARRGRDRGHRPDRAGGARLHRDAAVRLPAAAVPARGRRASSSARCRRRCCTRSLASLFVALTVIPFLASRC